MIASHGGVERVSLLLSRELAKRGYGICFLSVQKEEEKDMEGEFRQYFIGSKEDKEKAVSKYLELLKREKIDFVLAQFSSPEILALLEKTPKKIKKIYTLHLQPYAQYGKEKIISNLTPLKDKDLRAKILILLGRYLPLLQRKVYLKRRHSDFFNVAAVADRILFLSNASRKRFHKINKTIPPSKTDFINNPNTFSRVSGVNLESKENLMIFVGRMLHPQKNVTGFIDVWNSFHSLHADWNAIVIGDGEHFDIVKEYAEKKNTRGLVFVGNQKNVSEYYNKAKILCMTSVYEGWPMVINEAMAQGCVPACYGSFEAAYEIIDDDKNGIITCNMNPDELVDRLHQVVSREGCLRNMAEEGIRKIEKFSVENIVDQWEDKIFKPTADN